MPQPFEKAMADTSDIPKPELNPMTNPVLGRHLGRWAEVYFTTPVEQREQAVLELLIELKQGEESGALEQPETISRDSRLGSSSLDTNLEHASDRSVVDIDRPSIDRLAALEDAIRKFEVPRAEPQRQSSVNLTPEPFAESTPGACPVCQHWNQPEQWYCGMCGYKLRTEATSAPRVVPFKHEAQRTQRTPSSTDLGHETSPATEVQPTNAFSFSMFGQPLETTDAEPAYHATRAPMWPLEAVEELPNSRVGAKVAMLCVILLIAAVGFAYRDRIREVVTPWLQTQRNASSSGPQSPAGSEAPPLASTAPVAHPTLRSEAENAAPSVKKPTDEDAGTSAAEPAKRTTASGDAPSTDNQSATRSSAAPREGTATVQPSRTHQARSREQQTASLPAEGGDEELSRARELLAGGSRPVNPGQASVWLWKAVGKNNGAAILLLADLYARGSGVPQSCDQARILLGAAAKKGSTAAGQKLKEIQNSQCARH